MFNDPVTNETRIREVETILELISARLRAEPEDKEDWDKIIYQLRVAVKIAQLASLKA